MTTVIVILVAGSVIYSRSVLLNRIMTLKIKEYSSNYVYWSGKAWTIPEVDTVHVCQ